MRHCFHKFLPVLKLAALCLAASSCAVSGAGQAVADTLRVAVERDFPPYIQFDGDQAAGTAIDLLRAAAGKSGLELVFVPVPFEQMQASITDGRADAIYPVAINAERTKVFDFSSPLLCTGGGLFVRAPDATPANLDALDGKVVVTPKTGPLARYIEQNAPRVKLVVVKDYDESLSKLVSGEAAAAALNFDVGARLAQRQYPGKITAADKMFWTLPLALAMPKGQAATAAMLARLNPGVAAVLPAGPCP